MSAPTFCELHSRRIRADDKFGPVLAGELYGPLVDREFFLDRSPRFLKSTYFALVNEPESAIDFIERAVEFPSINAP